MSRTLLLSERQTIQKIRRIAHEVLEANFQEEEVVFAGVVERGYIFAELLNDFFKEISDIPTRLVKISLDKNAPLQSEILLDCDEDIVGFDYVEMPQLKPIKIPTAGKGFWGALWMWITGTRHWMVASDWAFKVDGEW